MAVTVPTGLTNETRQKRKPHVRPFDLSRACLYAEVALSLRGNGPRCRRGLLSFLVDRLGKSGRKGQISWLRATPHSPLYETRLAFVWTSRVSAIAILRPAGISHGGACHAGWSRIPKGQCQTRSAA